MRRFRIPEIALGFLLATALWALFSVFQPKYTTSKNAGDGKNAAEHGSVATAKNIDDRLATYTFWLVIFTAVLAASTIALWIETRLAGRRQSRDMKASVAAARQSAYAAEVAARAAQTTAETQIGAERAWFLLIIDEENFEDVLDSRLDPNSWPALIDASAPPDPLVKFHFENFGRSPAFVKEIATEIRNLDALPSHLTYSSNIPWNEEIVVPAGGRVPNAKDEEGKWRLFQHRLTGIDEQAARAIDRGEIQFWLYGRVIYEDIWGNEHVTRFCWGHDGRLDWFLPEGGKRYNERT